MKTINRLFSFIIGSSNDNKSLIPRLIVGLVFLSEGIQKFLFPELVGVGRFEKIGFADPAFWAYFVATFEIICGSLLLLGLLTRLTSTPLFIIMLTAFVTTKWPILMDKGFWAMAHEYRTDFAMTLLLIYLLIYGAGKWSVDSIIYKSIKS
ncbi:MAG TPA: DoxX family protein [Prolixibacteraceae bacterium]|nr:DoxX family protein [Prolixibacteraceae bacterium]